MFCLLKCCLSLTGFLVADRTLRVQGGKVSISVVKEVRVHRVQNLEEKFAITLYTNSLLALKKKLILQCGKESLYLFFCFGTYNNKKIKQM